ncbi:MAG: DUF2796 domain-containing protein [Pseudomonadota bacterium]
MCLATLQSANRWHLSHALAAAICIGAVVPVNSSEKRALASHEHGVSQLNIAFLGNQVAMQFAAPGADIVGFEYVAESTEDRAKIATALDLLAKPLDLFVLPDAADCRVVEAKASLLDEQSAHQHHNHGHQAPGLIEQAKTSSSHSEFRAEYSLSCTAPDAIDTIAFAFFDRFENARQVEVQTISDSGAYGFEVERDAPTLSLSGAI